MLLEARDWTRLSCIMMEAAERGNVGHSMPTMLSDQRSNARPVLWAALQRQEVAPILDYMPLHFSSTSLQVGYRVFYLRSSEICCFMFMQWPPARNRSLCCG